jgi:hypothetical protein
MSDRPEPADPPRPSDADPDIDSYGVGDVAASVVSMSGRHADGADAAYLEWHMLDHLPEQYRLAGLRHGQRWVSTPACRAARAASEAPYDAVDHIVQYLFAEPFEPALDKFFPLGGALRMAGRMPVGLPRVQVGGWNLARAVAAPRVLVGSTVLPWRPAQGAYVLVDRAADPPSPDALLAVEGVAGVWCWGGGKRHARFDDTSGLALTICYLDGSPLDVASAIAPALSARSANGVSPLLAAPFEAVVAGAWDRSLP